MAQLAGAAEYTDCISHCNQSDGEAPVKLEFWGMWSTTLLPLLPGSLWSGVVTTDTGPI